MTRVKKVEYLEEYKLKLTFSDKKIKVVDLGPFVKKGRNMIEPLKDIEFFKQVKVDGITIAWPNGVDLCPDVLYAEGKEVNKTKSILAKPKEIKERTRKVSLPIDIAEWIAQPEAIELVRRLMHKHSV